MYGLKEPVNCGGRNKRIGVAVGHAENKSGQDQLAGGRWGYPGAEVARYLVVETSSVNRLVVF